MGGNVSQDEEIREGFDRVNGFEIRFDPDRKVLPCAPIDNIQYTGFYAMVRLAFDKVMRPHMFGILAAIECSPLVQPSAPTLRLLAWQF